MIDPVVVFDSGVLDLATTDREFRSVVRELLHGGWHPLIPTVVLAEAISGRPTDAPANQAVRQLGTLDTSQAIARRAGHLRFRSRQTAGRRQPSGIDALVAAHAAEFESGVVFTTDPTDIKRLLAEFPRIAVERP